MKKNNLIVILLLCLWGFNFGYGQNDLKVGLVLSGGGAKGYAHIGVLEVLEEAGIKIDYIGGTSMGAIIGGLYASGYSASQMKKLIKDIDINQAIFEEVKRVETPLFSKLHEEKYFLTLEFDNFKLQIPKAISDGQGTLNILTEYLSHVHDVSDFDQLEIPFLCIATDIETGEQKIFKSGFLPEAVLASGAYPTLFEPVEIDNHYYVDGGVLNNFPAQEVIDMGADYIIGVDLGAGLMDYEEFSGATSIIEQIISFGIEAKTEEQRKLVDLLIVPDVKEISVTNFQLKDSIIQEGYKSADALRQTLDSLQKRQSPQRYHNQPLAIDSLLSIKDIQISGLSSYSRGYILGKMGIEPPDSVPYSVIIDGIAKLYATENFTQITHKLLNNGDDTRTLELTIEEKKNKFFARFGLHYDYLLKSALLANFTAKNLFTINSTLSVDAIVGDNPRFNINYFVDNGIRPSFGFNSSYKNFDVDKLEFINDNDELSYNYILQNFYNQLYMQSTLAERYAAGLGLEHNYLKLYTKNVEPGNPLRNIQNASFLIPYAFIKADSRDNSFFPKSGLYMNSIFKFFVGSTQENFEPTSMLKSFVEYNQTFLNNLTFQASSFVGMSFDKRLPNGYNYLLGGQNEHNILNSFNFSGIPFAGFSGRNTLGIGVGLQYAIKDRHYIKYNFDAANLSDDFILEDITNFKYTGHGLTYGYLSPVGPLQGSLTYSPNHKEVIPYIALGYWF